MKKLYSTLCVDEFTRGQRKRGGIKQTGQTPRVFISYDFAVDLIAACDIMNFDMGVFPYWA